MVKISLLDQDPSNEIFERFQKAARYFSDAELDHATQEVRAKLALYEV
jgi:hypothetical protein